MPEPLLEIEDLTIHYETDGDPLCAVSDASFTIEEGDSFGLVGESGCGKSTLAKSILGGLDSNGRVVDGTITYKGEELQDKSEDALNREIRFNEISWIPQGSMNSLDPLQKISDIAWDIAEANSELSKEEAMANFRETFEIVGLPEDRITDYPHQFSGGMQQRALIALSLFLKPSLLIADEPTTALDVIMQDQIFKHLDDIREDFGVSLLLITHDISVIFESCNALAIMHGGQVAEVGQIERLFKSPRHPYSILLQESFPDIRSPDKELTIIDGIPPQPRGDVDYCTFVDRCPWAEDECREHAPELESVATDSIDEDETHKVACFRKDDVYELYESMEYGGVKNAR